MATDILARRYHFYDNVAEVTVDGDVKLKFMLGTPWGQRVSLQAILQNLSCNKAPDLKLEHLAAEDVQLPAVSSTRLTAAEKEALNQYYVRPLVPYGGFYATAVTLGTSISMLQDPYNAWQEIIKKQELAASALSKVVSQVMDKVSDQKKYPPARTTFSVLGAKVYIELWTYDEDGARKFSSKHSRDKIMVEIGLEGDHFGSAEANTLQYLKLGHPWCRVREVEIEGFAIVDDSSKEQLGEFPVELHNEGDAEITTSFEMVQVATGLLQMMKTQTHTTTATITKTMNGEVGVSFVGSAKVSGSVAVAAALSEVSGTTESWSLSLANTLRATLSFKVPPQTTSRYIVRLFGVQKKGACNVRVYGHEAEAVTFTAFKHLEYTFEAAPQGPAVRNEAGASATASTAVSVVAAVALAALLVVVAARPS